MRSGSPPYSAISSCVQRNRAGGVLEHGGIFAVFAQTIANEHHNEPVRHESASDKSIIDRITTSPRAAMCEDKHRERGACRVAAVPAPRPAPFVADARRLRWLLSIQRRDRPPVSRSRVLSTAGPLREIANCSASPPAIARDRKAA